MYNLGHRLRGFNQAFVVYGGLRGAGGNLIVKLMDVTENWQTYPIRILHAH